MYSCDPIILCGCGWLSFIGSQTPTQPLFHSFTATGRENKVKNIVDWEKKWNETKKPNQNKNRYISYQNRLDLGKINLFCCQLKQIWLVRNKDRIKQYLPLVPPLFFFPGSTSHLHSWLSLEEQKKNLFLSHLFLCLVDNPRDEKIFMCYYLSKIMFSSLTWVSIGLPNQRYALHFILSNIFLVINLDFL